MKTTAILNPSAVAPNPAPKAQSGAGDSDMPFKQVLSREVAERREAEKPDSKQSGAANRSEEAAAGAAKTPVQEGDGSAEAALPAAIPAAGDAVAAQLLALVAQSTEFKPGAPEAMAGVRPGAERRPLKAAIGTAALPHGEPAKNLSVKDLPMAAASADAANIRAGEMHARGATTQEMQLGAAAAPATAQQTAAQPAAPGRTPETPFAMAAAAAVQQTSQLQAAGDKLMPRVGSNGWDQALGQKMIWMATGSMQSASLTLNPPDLGPLQVVLNVSNTQATANFIAAQAEVRQALEAAMPRLREMLEEAGIQLGEANVSAGTPQQQGAFSDRPQGSGSPEQAKDGGDTAILADQRSTTVHQGMVDTFA